jgi:multidrug efflux pump
MSLASTSIQRPVLTTVMSLAILIFGAIGFAFLGVREYPSVELPVVTVSTPYVGANSDVVEAQITEPLEEALSGIPGLRSIKSTSREQRSVITIEFTLETDLETATNDVRDRVSQALGRLPADADKPIVQKADADAVPIVFLSISSKKRDLLGLTKVANDVFKENFRSIPGVSEVQVWGEKLYAMRIWMNAQKLAAYKLTPQDIRTALQRENVELPSGRIDGDATELSIRTSGRLTSVEEFNNLVVRESDGKLVRLRDVGYAELGAENYRTILRSNGVPMVGTVLIPQPGANYVSIVDEFYKRLGTLKTSIPSDLELSIGFDNTRYIRRSIAEVVETIFIAFALVVAIIFLFLREWRATLIPVLAIPVSLIGAFFIMYLANFSINVLTLLGIVLAIGIVVDDAIVVLENIYAKIELGMNPREAALSGSREVYLAVIATTVALVAVFMPVVFLQGLTGRLFREFGVVLAGSVVISAFVALTLTPMMCSRLLRRHAGSAHSTHDSTHGGSPHGTHSDGTDSALSIRQDIHHNSSQSNSSQSNSGQGWFYRVTEPFFVSMTTGYKRSLESFMQRRWLGFVGMAAALGMIWLFGSLLPNELSPTEDRSQIRVNTQMPEGTSFAAMDDFMLKLGETLIGGVPEHANVVAVTVPSRVGTGSSNQGSVRLILVEREARTRSQQDIAASVSALVKKLPEARTSVGQEASIGSGGGRSLPLQFVVRAQSLDQLKKIIPDMLDAIRKNPVFDVVDVDLKFTKPEAVLDIDREKAQALGVSTLDVASTLQAALSGQRFGYFLLDGKQYQILGQVAKEDRNTPLDVRTLSVRNKRGDLIQLDNLISLREQSTTPQLYRFNRSVSATFSASMARGVTLGEGVKAMEAIASTTLDERFTTALDGEARDLRDSSSSLGIAFGLALLLVYLALAAQFESFRDPFTILLTVPLALAGAVLSLWYFNQTLNIFSQIGVIMLIGLVTKNGILVVEFANQRKAEGLRAFDAVQEAATERLRPILMTSIATILGTLPIALALGAGAESRVSMGIAIIGGLVFATFFTLYIIPALYSYISRPNATLATLATPTTTTALSTQYSSGMEGIVNHTPHSSAASSHRDADRSLDRNHDGNANANTNANASTDTARQIAYSVEPPLEHFHTYLLHSSDDLVNGLSDENSMNNANNMNDLNTPTPLAMARFRDVGTKYIAPNDNAITSTDISTDISTDTSVNTSNEAPSETFATTSAHLTSLTSLSTPVVLEHIFPNPLPEIVPESVLPESSIRPELDSEPVPEPLPELVPEPLPELVPMPERSREEINDFVRDFLNSPMRGVETTVVRDTKTSSLSSPSLSSSSSSSLLSPPPAQLDSLQLDSPEPAPDNDAEAGTEAIESAKADSLTNSATDSIPAIPAIPATPTSPETLEVSGGGRFEMDTIDDFAALDIMTTPIGLDIHNAEAAQELPLQPYEKVELKAEFQEEFTGAFKKDLLKKDLTETLATAEALAAETLANKGLAAQTLAAAADAPLVPTDELDSVSVEDLLSMFSKPAAPAASAARTDAASQASQLSRAELSSSALRAAHGSDYYQLSRAGTSTLREEDSKGNFRYPHVPEPIRARLERIVNEKPKPIAGYTPTPSERMRNLTRMTFFGYKTHYSSLEVGDDFDTLDPLDARRGNYINTEEFASALTDTTSFMPATVASASMNDAMNDETNDETNNETNDETNNAINGSIDTSIAPENNNANVAILRLPEVDVPSAEDDFSTLADAIVADSIAERLQAFSSDTPTSVPAFASAFASPSASAFASAQTTENFAAQGTEQGAEPPSRSSESSTQLSPDAAPASNNDLLDGLEMTEDGVYINPKYLRR